MNSDVQVTAQMSTPGSSLFNFNNFSEVMEAAKLLASSNIVPEIYQSWVAKTTGYGKGKNTNYTENPNAVANCLLALNMSSRLGADPLMIMQNLYLIEGRPAWSSQFIIAGINSCGRFTTLQFEFTDLGNKDIAYTETAWNNGNKETLNKSVNMNDFSCVAWATDKASGKVVKSSPITLEMAIQEGWYFKKGSKWQTMAQQMAMYRAAAFFGRVYAPEVTMGIYTKDEVEDFTEPRDVTPPQQQNNQSAISQVNQMQANEPVIEFINDEQVDILTKMIACITNPDSIANIKKAIPDVRLIKAAHFDSYQNKLKTTIDAQVIQDEKASYAQEQIADAGEHEITDVVDDIQDVIYDNQPMADSQQLEEQ